MYFKDLVADKHFLNSVKPTNSIHSTNKFELYDNLISRKLKHHLHSERAAIFSEPHHQWLRLNSLVHSCGI